MTEHNWKSIPSISVDDQDKQELTELLGIDNGQEDFDRGSNEDSYFDDYNTSRVNQKGILSSNFQRIRSNKRFSDFPSNEYTFD